MPSHLVKIALIYKESLYLQMAPQFWLYGFKNQTTTTTPGETKFCDGINQEKKN